MLVLTRNEGQKIVIIAPSGERIVLELAIKNVHHRRIKVLIDAPVEYKIFREEIVDVAIKKDSP